MNTSVKINFYLKTPKGDSSVFVNVMINNIRVKKVIPGIKIENGFWDIKKQKMKPIYHDKNELKRINGNINDIETKLSERFNNYELQIIKYDQLSNIVNGCVFGEHPEEIKIENTFDFFGYYEKYLIVSGNEVSKGFIKHQRSTMNKLKMFEQYTGKKLTFEGFGVDLFDAFFNFLLSSKKEENGVKQGIHNNSTINGHIKRIKIFLSAAKNKKWHNSIEYKDYKRKRQAAEDEAPIIALNWEEFILLYETQLKSKFLEKVRDIFAFSCLTGLRYSDYSKLTKKEFRLITVKDSKGETRQLMETYIVKNRRRVTVKLPFSEYALEIVKKYDNTPNPFLLPDISDGVINDGIKRIAKLIGLNDIITTIYYSGGEQIKEINYKWEVISTHTGRKTFISKCVEAGVPLHVVASYTGHSKNSKALARYYEISDRMKVDYIPMDLYQKRSV